MTFQLPRAQHIVLFIFIIGMGFTALASAELTGPVVEAVSYYNLAVDAAANESYDEAMILIDKTLQIQPDFYLAQITKAGLLSQNEKYNEAERLLNQAESTHPDNPYVLAAKSSFFVQTGRYEESLIAADGALKNDPTLVEAWINKGTAHGGLAQYEEELNASLGALTYDPENPDAISNYNFAKQAIMMDQNKSHPDDAEKTPLFGFVALVAVLSAVALVRVLQR